MLGGGWEEGGEEPKDVIDAQNLSRLILNTLQTYVCTLFIKTVVRNEHNTTKTHHAHENGRCGANRCRARPLPPWGRKEGFFSVIKFLAVPRGQS